MIKKDEYLPCGNERVAIPELRESDGSILSITLLHMGYKGMIEIRGEDENPLMTPFVKVNGEAAKIGNLAWSRQGYWIPCFKAESDFQIQGTVLPPIGERGFVYRLSVKNVSNDIKSFTLGLKGAWDKTIQAINESKAINGRKYAYHSNWNKGMVLDLRSDVNIFSFAPVFEEAVGSRTETDGDVDAAMSYEQINDTIFYFLSKTKELKSGEEFHVDFYWGFGYEEVGATTAGIEMVRKGYDKLLNTSLQWLHDRARTTGKSYDNGNSDSSSDEELDKVLNTNLFFNFFFASGITLDTEEFVLVTSRSPRYYVSAAYWDRDSLLWSFPSILLVDRSYAKEMLDYIFTRQIKNVGIHSRYIDGTVLEPGFELDELCAPIIALKNYVKETGDVQYLFEIHVLNGIKRILKVLESKKHSDIELYETFLQPTDDMNVYPYLTYDNVLAYRALSDISYFYQIMGKNELSEGLKEKAEKVKNAIWENCIVLNKDRKIFAWSVDLKGHFNVYDEPPGSLQLLPFYEFCTKEDEIYINTVKVIRDQEYAYSFANCNIEEIGCEHAPHPWILSLANSLVCGRTDHGRKILSRTRMDNGIACESIDENTGECTTGEAFATCAGFLAYSIYHAFGSINEK